MEELLQFPKQPEVAIGMLAGRQLFELDQEIQVTLGGVEIGPGGRAEEGQRVQAR